MSSLNIAISFNNESSLGQVMFQSGIAQNAKFLYDLLLRIGQRPYFLVSSPAAARRLEICGLGYKAYDYREVLGMQQPTHLALEVGVTIGQAQRQQLRQKFGTKIVSVRYGHSMYMDMEEMCGDVARMKGAIHVNCPDRVWASPHFEAAFSYLETLYQAPVQTCPFIWEPDFVRGGPKLGYKVKPNVYVMEPNLSVLKNALIPMAIIERQYREAPETFGAAYILNGQKFNERPYFVDNIVRNFSSLIAQSNKAYFCGRARFVDVFKERDVLVGHQVDCQLNYLYMEAVYRNVPLVHNSPAFREVGFYYEGCDVRAGRAQLNAAIEAEDVVQQEEAGQRFLDGYSIHNGAVQAAYQGMIDELFR
ncbi:DUF2827 family protein [Coraliomargarita sp. SDUM461004]|uniref:DUF2827 family protein n=1 Tax=Thalassobacterium sedimentorum TaxID=3041258 RepID=A0ABU1AL85_9BACT|nr:DUF2827 family protein [Coraliomargarita sp. SDUM461004]MDQ8195572.1 DUF2827 family protein [Coraliomargarita sp. SDUM461004]